MDKREVLSFQELKESDLHFSSTGWGVELLLGIVTRSYEDLTTKKCLVDTGGEAMEYDTLYERLKRLSNQTGKQYSRRDIDENMSEKKGSEEDYSLVIKEYSLVAVGRVIPGLMHAGEQDHNGFIKYNTLIEHLNSHQEIIRDLESIGFKNISPDDLILTAHALRH